VSAACPYPLAEEYPVELVANGTRIAILMCTPRNLDELAIGHLYTRGILLDPSTVLTVGACADLRIATVVTSKPLGGESLGLGQVIASGCGAGLAFSQAFSARPPLKLGWTVGLDDLKKWARAMFDAAELYRSTGGMHCAALATADGVVRTREDVGRHNAVDKVIGRGLLDRIDFSKSCLLTSGRIAADMILKAVAAGIPVVVSRSIPTTTAWQIARQAGVSVIGRIESREPHIYCQSERIHS
jgi:FdhD protein